MAAPKVVLEFQDCIQALGRECYDNDAVSAKGTTLENMTFMTMMGICHPITNLILYFKGYLPFNKKNFQVPFINDRTEPLICIRQASLLGDTFWDEGTFYIILHIQPSILLIDHAKTA